MHLHLLIPELIWPGSLDPGFLNEIETPSLDWLLARATETRLPPATAEAALCRYFIPDPEPKIAPPYAALARYGETGIAPQEHWLHADPVHLLPTYDTLILNDATRLGLTATETEALIATLNATFSDRLHCTADSPSRWYMQLKEPVSCNVVPLSQVAGRSILPFADEAKSLHVLLTEIQMVLSDHPVNRNREDNHQLTVNSLWLWGEGALQTHTAAAFTYIAADSPLAVGLALNTGIPHLPFPSNASVLFHLTKPCRILAVCDALTPAAQYNEDLLWRHNLLVLEQNWFAPLKQALNHKITTLTITTTSRRYGHLQWHIDGKSRWRFWRRPLSWEQRIAHMSNSEKTQIVHSPPI